MRTQIIKTSFRGELAPSFGSFQATDTVEYQDDAGNALPGVGAVELNRDMTTAELATVIGAEAQQIIAANATLTQQNADLQNQVAAYRDALTKANDALVAVKSANAQWDTATSAGVDGALAQIAALNG